MIPHKATGTFVEADIDGELVLMNIDTGRFSGLAGTAHTIWNMIDGARDVATMKAELADAYGTPIETCGPEVDAFLAKLEAAGFVTLG